MQVENGTQIETLLNKKGKEALGAVRQIVDPLWNAGKKRDWRPAEVDRRLTRALSKKMDEFVISILGEQRLIRI